MPAIIDGKACAAQVRADVKERVSRISFPVRLAVVVVGDDPASAVYVRNKKRACEECGIRSSVYRLGEETTTDKLVNLVKALGADDTVTGILVQLPLPLHIDTQRVIEAIPPEKDVDCFHPTNVGLLMTGRPIFSPCTPAGIMELLLGYPLKGRHCVILGRSNIVGKPLAQLMLQADATVTVCHSKTNYARLLSEIGSADVVIAAMGNRDVLKPQDHIYAQESVLIDVGINRDENGKLCGDFPPSWLEVSKAYTPVPGGVGPMTVAMLMRNTLIAAVRYGHA